MNQINSKLRQIIVLGLIGCLLLPSLALAKSRRKMCREIERECLAGVEGLSFEGFEAPSQTSEQRCELVYEACLKDEMNITCPEIYKHRARKQQKHRDHVFALGGTLVAFSIVVGIGSMSGSAMSGVTALPGLGILLVGSSLGGILIGFSQIPGRSEKVFSFYDEGDLGHRNRFFNRQVAELSESSDFIFDKEIMNDLFKEKFERGDFCRNYPRLAGPRQIVREVLEEYRNIDILGEQEKNREERAVEENTPKQRLTTDEYWKIFEKEQRRYKAYHQ